MASAETTSPKTDISSAQTPSFPTQESQSAQSQQASSRPIELQSLPDAGQAEQKRTSIFGPTSYQSAPAQQLDATDTVTAAATTDSQHVGSQMTPAFLSQDPQASASTDQVGSEMQSSHPPLTRTETAPAIGPATDKPTIITKEVTDGPVLLITLLLASSGARHPYKLDSKYLKKRSVEVEDNNPINMSLYKLKELILRDWRSGMSSLSHLEFSITRY